MIMPDTQLCVDSNWRQFNINEIAFMFARILSIKLTYFSIR